MRIHPHLIPVSALAFAMCAGATSIAQSDSSASASSTTTQNQTAPATAGQKPIQQQNEGFWGHMNPFARKKWVKRQTDPIREREDELDYVTAKNANDIRDVDSRATAGINHANQAADAANTVATNAGNTARSAQTTADQASSQATSLSGTVAGLDKYSQVSSATIRFQPGSTVLGPKARKDLDAFADQLNSDKGFVLEVDGYVNAHGTAGAAQSERMADAVERYLVAKHNIPVYRIAKLGYGSSRPADQDIPHGSVVQVTLLHNSLAAINQPSTQPSPQAGSQAGAAQTLTTPSPGASAPQPDTRASMER